jgi:plastocyanin
MRVPRVLLALPLILAGALLPAIGPEPATAPAPAVGMAHLTFTRDTITVRVGETVTFVNDSRFVHIIGSGRDGVSSPHQGDPTNDLKMLETKATYITGRWNYPGTYHVTCTVHPAMNITVIVTP